ncbi:DUF421 domain-containing protein [Cohnella abietis]|uniref:UPF0702 transmembrane protein YdfS n=1 Tax=Cohnella abietis TaxID=2507935 RepID=A0A3T1D812_9BACL|nr:DUF421 domain-containing protein [Cohnella abietis]BBI34222.1 UPF0702 transmembrane protein YdfS [Cohnella abietis]
MNISLEIVLRTLISFILVLTIAKILGKHTLAQMTYYDFVSSITLGSITGNLAFNYALKTTQLTIALLTFGGISYIVALITLKNRKLRKSLSGKPTIVIENGKIMEENLKKLQFSLDTLDQELREKDIFDIQEVEYAVLELNGKLSVLKKFEYRQITQKDFMFLSGAKAKRSQFPIELIMDGEIIKDNFVHDGISLEWLSQQLNERSLNAADVFYAVKGTNGSLYFDLYKDNLRHPVDSNTKH